MLSSAIPQEIPSPAASVLRAGEHLWVMVAAWEVEPTALRPGNLTLVGPDNLIMAVGPRCFHCEQDYRPQLATLPCPGPPDGAGAGASNGAGGA